MFKTHYSITVESLKFVVVFMGSPTQQIYILDENKFWKNFPSETEIWWIQEITASQISKKPTIYEK